MALRKEGKGVVLDCQLPHLIGIDEDLLSTGIVLYYLKVNGSFELHVIHKVLIFFSEKYHYCHYHHYHPRSSAFVNCSACHTTSWILHYDLLIFTVGGQNPDRE